jgi:hypothetical protein
MQELLNDKILIYGKLPDGSHGPFSVNSGMAIPDHDYVLMDPPSQPTTITYKVGGASGTVVAILTLTYDGSNVESVTRS